MNKHLDRLKQKLVAITKETGCTHRYDTWTEARKSLAHELLASLGELERDLDEEARLSPAPKQDSSVLQRADAWTAVCKVLNEVAPDWLSPPMCGRDCAVAKIRELAKQPSINVRCEVRCEGGIVGSTFLDVERVNPEDDGSYTVVVPVESLPRSA